MKGISERFPDPGVLVAERFGDVVADVSTCRRCGKPLNDPEAHYPEILGGKCIPADTGNCPECGGKFSCDPRCTIARLR